MRTLVRAGLDLDVRGACVRRKKPSQLTPWFYVVNLTLGEFGPYPGGSCGGQGGLSFYVGTQGGNGPR